ncbi:MAG: hypothetical protein WA728_07845 [Xanthobacteraceae bacterium]
MRRIFVMSALAPKADITERKGDVSFVPKADFTATNKRNETIARRKSAASSP